MDAKKRLQLKMLIEELEKVQGRGTELVSYYVPANYDMGKLLEHLSYEHSTAQNIQDKTTRQNVMDALAKIINYVKGLKKVPSNGLVIFCGNVSDKPGKTDIRLWVIEPPEPLNIRLYRCDSKFVLEPLKELLEPKKVYGLVVLDRGEASIGVLKGKKIIVLESRDSWVPGKHHKGGQSSVRFQRLIDQSVVEWLKYLGDKCREFFEKYDNLEGILVGGPGPLKERFVKEDFLPYYLKQKILGIFDTGYSNEHGLRELVEKAKDILEKTEYLREVKLVKKFFELLAKNPDLIVYGYEDVKNAIESGAAEKVLISEDFDREKIKELLELAEVYGTEVEIISKDTSEGEQFQGFKIGAILRYKLY